MKVFCGFMKRKVLTQSFFEQPALKVAKDLIGKFLVRRFLRFSIPRKPAPARRSFSEGGSNLRSSASCEAAMMITEVEAYDGFQDKASHASRGKTKRNKVMFGEAGRFYVYFVYGFHNMLNIVTGKKNYPSAILIRGAGDISGPGRLTKFLKIDKRLNGKMANKESGLWLEDRGTKIPKNKIKKTPRIGVSYAGPIWSKKHYRFVLKSLIS
jgi:DNA-3-methyladenine glycosylase